MEIKKKTWPEFFELILKGKKKTELRLADFEMSEGDTLILEEFNPNTGNYTGRIIKKKVKNLTKVNPTQFHDIEKIKKFGFYLIEME